MTVEVIEIETKTEHVGDVVFEDSCKKVVISKETGLIESYVVDGKEYVSGKAFCPELYEDNADPWGWTFDIIGKNPVQAVLDDRTVPFAEQGKHEFNFRFGVHDTAVSDNLAQEFCEPVYALNAFPAGTGKKVPAVVRLSNQSVTLAAMYYEDGGYMMRLFNDNDTKETCEVSVGNAVTVIEIGAFEIYTMRYSEGVISKYDLKHCVK